MRRTLPAVLAIVLGIASLAWQPPAQALEPEPEPALVQPPAPAAPSADPAADPSADPSPSLSPSPGNQDEEEGSAPVLTPDEGAGLPNLQLFLLPSWLGPGNAVRLVAMVRNGGTAVSSAYTLDFSPQERSDREVTADGACGPSPQGGFRCAGDALQPGEERLHMFAFAPPGAVETWPPFWTAAVIPDLPEAISADDRATFELPDSTFVRVEADVKTRVEDTDRDGRASSGEPLEVYVHFVNTSEYALEEVTVAVTGTIREQRRLEGSVAPGEETTVRFEATLPSIGPDSVSGVEADVVARAAGATVRTASGTLMLMGPGAVPNPEGLHGEQHAAVRYEVYGAPTESIADPSPLALFSEGRGSGEGSAETRLSAAPVEPPAASGPDDVAGAVLRSADRQEALATRTAAAQTTTQTVAAQAVQGAASGTLSITGSSQRDRLIAVHVLLALGVVFAHVGISRQLDRARAKGRR